MQVTEKDTDLTYLREIEVHPVKDQQMNYLDTLTELKKVNGVHVVYENEDETRIIALIDNYDASVRIGSKNWCISSVIYGGSLGNANGINYWNMYLRNPDHRQYFVWDFKQSSEEWVLVGTTTNEIENNIYCAYNYPNRSFSMENYIQENNWDRSLFFDNDQK